MFKSVCDNCIYEDDVGQREPCLSCNKRGTIICKTIINKGDSPVRNKLNIITAGIVAACSLMKAFEVGLGERVITKSMVIGDNVYIAFMSIMYILYSIIKESEDKQYENK